MRKQPKQGLTTRELSDVVDESEQVLSYWKRTGLIDPIPGTEDRPKSVGLEYSLKETQKTMTISALREQDVPLQKIREAIDALDEYGENLASAVLYTDGEGIYEVKEKNELELTDLVGSPGQYTTMEFFDLGKVAEKAKEAYEEKVA